MRPVPEGRVEAVLPFRSRQVAVMVRLQTLTGMRPGQVCAMRGTDLDTAGPIWLYRPTGHKTAHHGHAREVSIGPRAQEVIKPFLKSDGAAYLFSPAEADAERRAKRHADRTPPLLRERARQ